MFKKLKARIQRFLEQMTELPPGAPPYMPIGGRRVSPPLPDRPVPPPLPRADLGAPDLSAYEPTHERLFEAEEEDGLMEGRRERGDEDPAPQTLQPYRHRFNIDGTPMRSGGMVDIKGNLYGVTED